MTQSSLANPSLLRKRWFRWISCFGLCSAWLLFGPNLAWAKGPINPSPPEEASPEASDQDPTGGQDPTGQNESAVRNEISCTMGALAGARRYRAGVWGLVEFRAVNQTDETADVQVVLRFVDDPTIEFSRRASLLPHSVLRSTCPILVPESVGTNQRNIDFLTERIVPPKIVDPEKKASPQEVLLRAQPMILDHEDPTVGMVAELQRVGPSRYERPIHVGLLPGRPDMDYPIYDMVLAAKRARNLSRRVSSFDSGDLPSDPACLDVLDVLVLSSDRIASDPAGLALVRDWVLSGGRLWIMLHDVQAATVSAVMGDAFTCEVVDRVELTSVTLHNSLMESDVEQDEHLEFEEPVRFARMIPEGVTTTYTVNDWPAAFWQPFGAGRIYFTTIGPSAWMRPTTGRDRPPQNRENATPFFPREPLKDLANDCLGPRDGPPLGVDAFKPFLSQQIGYQILSAGTVLAILTGFCATLIVAGWWLQRTGHLERMLWAAPLAAALFGLVFLTLGFATKRAVPPTVAKITRVTFESGVGEGHTSGLIAMYNQDANSERLGAKNGGLFFPDMTALGGRNRRITWTDEGAWHWDSLELPAGVRTAPFQRPLALDAAVDCRASFGPDGLQGYVGPMPLRGLEDTVIAIPNQNSLAVSVDEEGTFRADADNVLAPGEFMSESLLSDEQVRRKQIYDQILGSKPKVNSIARPLLYGWSDPLDTGFVFPQTHRRESTFFSIPLRLQRSPPGTVVRIPSTFVPYRAVVGPDGTPPAAYANLMHEWIEFKMATTEWLRFQMPATVLPLKLNKASVSINVRAPSRTLEILTLVGDRLVPVTSLRHPIGLYHCTIDQSEQLQLDAEGGLRIAVRVSADESADPKDQMTQAAWRIEQLQLEVTGTVQGEGYE